MLAASFADRPGVTLPGSSGRRGFGSAALKTEGSIFAMLIGGALVVKLPAARVAALVAEGPGLPFDGGKGTPMREWVALPGSAADEWAPLAEEAHAFVASRRSRSG
jgi:TfoX/Sxy family transcriptional regulator of competence genes